MRYLTETHTMIVVDEIFDSIKKALLRGDKVEIRGFGNFPLKTREPRKARNPRTGEKVQVSAKKVPAFKVVKELREVLNEERG